MSFHLKVDIGRADEQLGKHTHAAHLQDTCSCM